MWQKYPGWIIGWFQLPSGNSYNYGKSPCLVGKSTVSMAIFNSYVSLPEGTIIEYHRYIIDSSIEMLLAFLPAFEG